MSRSLPALLHSRYGNPASPAERREFLKATLAASAGLLLSNNAWAMNRLGRTSQKRIVVIGAGFAGLTCAHELKSMGYDVTILEARNRIGGRVLSFNAANGNEYIKGRNIEGGAELIGSNHPAWVSYAEKFKLEWLDVSEEADWALPVVIDGKALTHEEGKKLWDDMEAALGQMNEIASKVNEDEPWKSEGADKLDKTSTGQWTEALDLPALVKKAMLINQTADNGQDPFKQSFLGQLACIKGHGLEKYWTDTEVYRCKGGNDQLARKLAEGIGQARVNLKLAAKSITLKGNVIVIEASDGRTLECDDVVLAVPPTVWNKSQFSPALPAAMTPQMGLNTKFLAHVKERFWEKLDPKLSQYALSNGLIQLTWDATDAQGPVEGGAEGSNGGACLTGFAGGPVVERALNMSKEDREKAFAECYEAFFPGYKANLVATRYMDWPKEQWTGASYSFPAPGQVTTVGPLMAQSHLSGRLHLAGEHACYKFVGYMEGGLSSGASVAKRLAVRDGLTK